MCPAGYYCPSGTTFPNKCAPGFYSDTGAIACTLCEIGTYCPNEATTISEKVLNVCPAGVYCMRQLTNFNMIDPITLQSISYTGKVGLHVYPDLVSYYCLKGYYCPAGTKIMIPCPAGTYNRLFGRKNILDCVQTDPGYYTDVEA
jgi:hypothetical protein